MKIIQIITSATTEWETLYALTDDGDILEMFLQNDKKRWKLVEKPDWEKLGLVKK